MKKHLIVWIWLIYQIDAIKKWLILTTTKQTNTSKKYIDTLVDSDAAIKNSQYLFPNLCFDKYLTNDGIVILQKQLETQLPSDTSRTYYSNPPSHGQIIVTYKINPIYLTNPHPKSYIGATKDIGIYTLNAATNPTPVIYPIYTELDWKINGTNKKS